MYVKKRWIITAVSFIVGAILILAGFVIMYYTEGTGYKTTMSYPQKENIISLAESLEQIDYSLKKGSYAETPYQTVVLAANVLLETGSAKEDLQHLPVYDLALEKTAKYLSQTGEFVFKLAEKTVKGEAVTEEDQASLRSLSEKATELASELRSFSDEVSSENYGYDSLSEFFKSKKNEAAAAASSDGSSEVSSNIFERIEDSFKDMLPIYYDGKFSDIKETEPDEFWNGKEPVSKEKALETAAFVMDIEKNSVKSEPDIKMGNFDCYRFTAQNGDKDVIIIKNGGYLYSYNNNIEVKDSVVSESDAIKSAEEFLKNAGFTNMSCVRTVFEGNIMTAAFVSEKDGILIYPEIVTVGVSLDNKTVTSFISNDFWKNLKQNRVFASSVTEKKAAENLSDKLKVKSVNKVFTISEGGYEYPCYEFIADSERDGEVRVYINSQTGNEENIILVSKSEQGTFFR